MKEKFSLALLVAILVVSVTSLVVGVKNKTLGTSFTVNPSTSSYTDSGADWRQNLQAVSERMAGLSQYQILQANSAGQMEAVAPSALAGTTWDFDALSTDSFFTDSLNYLESNTILNLTVDVTTTTLTLAMSGETFYFGGVSSTAFVLPDVTTATGTVYRFVVDGAMSEDITVRTSALGDEIEGALIVAGAVVDCAAEDTLTFVADGENLGDFVELRSNGSDWFIGASGALTASKLTCSAT